MPGGRVNETRLGDVDHSDRENKYDLGVGSEKGKKEKKTGSTRIPPRRIYFFSHLISSTPRKKDAG